MINFEVEGEYRMLQKLNKIQYSKLIDIASTHDCGCVYPLSVAEGIQEGEIYTGSERNYNIIRYFFGYKVDLHIFREMLTRTF